MASENPTAVYVNRELSWLSFNERVLEEAEDARVPLFERMRFVSIYGSNLDEFFMVRVGALYDQSELDLKNIDGKTGMTVEAQIAAIYDRAHTLLPRVETCYGNLVQLLHENGIFQVDVDHLTPYQETVLEKYYVKNIQPFLAPQIIDKHHPFPYLSNKEQFIGIRFETDNDKMDFAVIPVATQHYKRYFIFPDEAGEGYCFVMMEPLIYHFADRIFRKKIVREKFVFRITRNGDLKVEEALYDEDLDWRSQMEQIINKRKRSAAVRLQISKKPSPDMLQYLLKKMELDERAVFIAPSLPLSLNFVYGLLGELQDKYPALNYPPLQQLMPPGVTAGDSIMRHLDTGNDIFLSYPYHSIKTFLDLLDEAAVDPNVTSIKITLYRIASGSKVAQALIKAAENGKDVLVLVELKARFDEEHNIVWSKRLEEAGCLVIYGLENYKVHSKLCVITRRDGRDVNYITQIGTGNYNEKTARQYTDFSLITVNRDIGEEALRVFLHLQMGTFVDQSRYLLVAPLQMKDRFIEFIDQEIAAAQAGEEAQITIKVNGLSHKQMIDKLIEASQAGVRVTLYVRGICCLRPDMVGYTDHITIKSMIGRYLEHPRIYHFGVGARERIFLGSADWMTRNLEYRVEVAVQVLDAEVQKIIRDTLAILAQDNVRARVMQQDATYIRLYPGRNEHSLDSQLEQYEYFKQASKEALSRAKQKTTATAEPATGGLLGWLKRLFGK